MPEGGHSSSGTSRPGATSPQTHHDLGVSTAHMRRSLCLWMKAFEITVELWFCSFWCLLWRQRGPYCFQGYPFLPSSFQGHHLLRCGALRSNRHVLNPKKPESFHHIGLLLGFIQGCGYVFSKNTLYFLQAADCATSRPADPVNSRMSVKCHAGYRCIRSQHFQLKCPSSHPQAHLARGCTTNHPVLRRMQMRNSRYGGNAVTVQLG